MAGKRLLDIAALFNASRGVAQKHVALRSKQLDVYNRTSTLAQALRNQTDRVTETVKAASFIASRLNESAPAWASDATDGTGPDPSNEDNSIPRKETTEGTETAQKPKAGLGQDHFYERPTKGSASNAPPVDDLEIQQEKADRYPLPDGTIPPRQSDVNTSNIDHDIISARPQDEASKEPLHNDGLHPASSDTSSIPAPARRPLSSTEARTMQYKSELQIPSKSADALENTVADPLEEGHDEESFYRKSGHSSPALSSLPRVKIPKHPSDTQKSDSHLPEGSINSDSFYSALNTSAAEQIPSVGVVPEQEQVPEGINTDIFHSARVAELLSGKPHGSKRSDLQLKGVKDTPVEHTNVATDTDQDTFNVRSSSQNEPTPPETNSEPHISVFQVARHSKEAVEGLVQDSANKSNRNLDKVRLVLDPRECTFADC